LDAKAKIKVAKQAIKEMNNEVSGENTDKSLKLATYELELFRQRRDELKAALRKASTVDNNPVHTGKGKGKATTQSFSAPESHHPALSAPAAESEGEDGPEDEQPQQQQPPLRRSPRRKNGQPAKPKPAAPKETKPWKHDPKQEWKMRGIIGENEKDDTYLIVWDGLYSDETPWNNSWQRQYRANSPAKEDWERRKGNPDLRGKIDENSAFVVDDE
jgi:hypothetical protein